MAIYNEHIVDIDMESGTIHRSFINKSIGEGDSNGNRYGVRLFRNGEPVDMTGVTCNGYFVRHNGTSVAISGQKSGNKCYVELPLSCYTVEGTFKLSIKLTKGTTTITALIIDGEVVDTVTGAIIDPGSVIPDISAFATLVSRVETAAETIEDFDISATQITGTRYKIVATEPS